MVSLLTFFALLVGVNLEVLCLGPFLNAGHGVLFCGISLGRGEGTSCFTGSYCMRRSRRFYQRGSNIDVFFFIYFFDLMRGDMIQITLKPGHHRSASETPFKWRFAGVSMMA